MPRRRKLRRPARDGLVLLPYFSGERTPIHDPHAKGVLFGLNLTHTRGDIYRALLEGIAYGTNHIVETYRDAGEAPRRVLAVGGGVKNKVWSQATSDVSGLPQSICGLTIGASYGDAFLAALGIGDVKRDDIRALEPRRLGDQARAVGGLSSGSTASTEASTTGRRISCGRSSSSAREQEGAIAPLAGLDPLITDASPRTRTPAAPRGAPRR